MQRMRIPLVLLAVAFRIAPAAGEAMMFTSPTTQVPLIELYTSEGCSSCPPADWWLSALTQDARLWQGMVPVAFHVDYWDDIGWKDRFASPNHGLRQRHYALTGE